jgi:hypothetical protein
MVDRPPHDDNPITLKERDLRELLTIDAVQQLMMATGTFFSSGATWLSIEKLMEQERFQMAPLLWVCAVAIAAGGILFGAGFILYLMRRRKVRNIFSEVD